MGAIGLIIIGILILIFIPNIFFLLTLQKTLKKLSTENQAMEPGLVWINLIPLVNMVFMFFTVIYVSNSLKNEFNKRKIVHEGRPGYGLGLAFAILNCCNSIIPLLTSYPPIHHYINPIFIIKGIPLLPIIFLIIWIIYWVKIVSLSRLIKNY